MQNISTLARNYFIYFTSYANTVLNCTKRTIIHLFPNNSYCEMRYYINEDDLFQNALEIQIDKGTLLCYFDEEGKCYVCYVHFNDIDEVSEYIKLCDTFFEYCPIMKKWKLFSNYIMYYEDKNEKYFAFRTNRL